MRNATGTSAAGGEERRAEARGIVLSGDTARPPRAPSPEPYEETRYHLERGRRLQADAVAGWLGRLAGLVRRLSGGWHRRRERARVLRELTALDDHLLRDIGIGRDEIWAVASGASPRAHPRQPAAPHPGRGTIATEVKPELTGAAANEKTRPDVAA